VYDARSVGVRRCDDGLAESMKVLLESRLFIAQVLQVRADVGVTRYGGSSSEWSTTAGMCSDFSLVSARTSRSNRPIRFTFLSRFRTQPWEPSFKSRTWKV